MPRRGAGLPRRGVSVAGPGRRLRRGDGVRPGPRPAGRRLRPPGGPRRLRPSGRPGRSRRLRPRPVPGGDAARRGRLGRRRQADRRGGRPVRRPVLQGGRQGRQGVDRRAGAGPGDQPPHARPAGDGAAGGRRGRRLRPRHVLRPHAPPGRRHRQGRQADRRGGHHGRRGLRPQGRRREERGARRRVPRGGREFQHAPPARIRRARRAGRRGAEDRQEVRQGRRRPPERRRAQGRRRGREVVAGGPPRPRRVRTSSGLRRRAGAREARPEGRQGRREVVRRQAAVRPGRRPHPVPRLRGRSVGVADVGLLQDRRRGPRHAHRRRPRDPGRGRPLPRHVVVLHGRRGPQAVAQRLDRLHRRVGPAGGLQDAQPAERPRGPQLPAHGPVLDDRPQVHPGPEGQLRPRGHQRRELGRLHQRPAVRQDVPRRELRDRGGCPVEGPRQPRGRRRPGLSRRGSGPLQAAL